MPSVEVKIGGRSFSVACSPGEESYLQTAAQMLDIEAQTLLGSGSGRMTETTILLMSGLMLADKTAGLEDRIKQLEAELEAITARPVERVEVPVIPQQALEHFAELTARAEALAEQIESQKPEN